MSAIALVTDVIFATKLKSTADAIGMPLSVVKSVEALEEAAEAGVNFAIVDMNAENVDGLNAVRRCKSALRTQGQQTVAGPDDASPGPVVIAFAQHVQKELLEAAENAGADLVVSRSSLSSRLPDLLAEYGQMRERR